MAAKSPPFSLRLDASLYALIASEAQRTRRSKASVLESLADEALRARRFPGIAFRGSDWNRRPWIIGTALDVWEVVDALRDFGTPERLLAESDLTETQLHVAVAYYEEFREEIDSAIAENRRSLEELHREYPTIDVLAAR
ncbi:MAG TPA: DUF433 domain-containing protein [Solirubrobacteraceae bacterium]|nr:DUF433 domain-containing protein [Solirubrobacteraceae bacterium]